MHWPKLCTLGCLIGSWRGLIVPLAKTLTLRS
uniref:Uncharacterized protein n=1 Tax=Rhizophora mucronata TaxID=61149 RepID=A0A2P2QS45_RHIMU